MQASELRIGNIIKLESSIVHVTHFDIRQISRGSVYEPIPLTPEILDACGFEKDKNGELCLRSLYFIDSAPDGGVPSFIQLAIGPTPVTNMLHINHLHQLQNLYFSLVGEELTINFPVMSKSE